MYFAVNIRLYDMLIALQGLQEAAALVVVIIVGYYLFKKQPLGKTAKLWLWSLAAVWAITGVGLYGDTLRNYLHDYRPIYQKENFQETGLK